MMSTKKIVLLILATLLGLLVLASAYLYTKPENRYVVHSGLKTLRVSAMTHKLRDKVICANSENKPNCLNTLVLDNGGIEFSSDVVTFLTAALTVCEYKGQSFCFFETADYLLNQIEVEKLWVYQSVPKSDKMYDALVNMDVKIIENVLRDYRKKLSDFYTTETDPAKKLNALNFLKLVDGKIQLMQRSQKRSL